MKVLVVSDNHGDQAVLENLFAHYQGKVDAMFHCGDSELDSASSIWKDVYVVRGNCDFDEGYPEKLVAEVAGNRIFMTHGHLYQVKSSMNPLKYAALEEQANFAFFGHTHELGVEKIDDLIVLNPGSIRLPRGQYPIKTYAIVEATDSEVHVQYYDVAHQPIEALAFTFLK
ncbi:metallophosphoesterase [Isobaculum melis]|uniref:Phosphoesterase n=1 Tax=Isobaculum melis TaxID=142588 RepID=A0A1H9RJA3_9LACT|nr:metallophosphoesterase [Isobaculum melis]SER72625.1 hypothetical protein SAMN04488559_10477 [Isobaculum melis]